ncbi:MAG: alkaline phosphatase family protein [Deltaproteobacteria bacterium]|nr:alkaline phosphatase family protein [Deltaproteobacteria bacterium]
MTFKKQWGLALVFVTATVAANTADAAVRSDRRVVILGIDGLKPQNLHRYLTDPKYAELREGGFLAKMLSPEQGTLTPEKTTAIFPSYTWPAWATIFTGHFPGKHGIFGQEFLARDRNDVCSPYPNIVYGQRAYGYDYDLAVGRAKLESIVEKFGFAKSLARKAIRELEGLLAKAVPGFTFDRMLSDLKPVGHSMATDFLLVNTVYDWARDRGLSTHNVFNFYHHKKAPSGVPEGFSRPDKETLLRIGIGDQLGDKLAEGDFEKALRVIDRLGDNARKHLDPILGPLRRYRTGHPLRAIGFMPEKYVNRNRGHIYFDQVAADKALAVVKRGLPHILNIYQSAVDACSHWAEGQNPDKQATCLGFVDRNLKPVIDAIKSDPAYKNTMFVIVSDHGHSTIKNAVKSAVTRELLTSTGMVSDACEYYEARNGNMSHIYFVSKKTSVARWKGLACGKSSGPTALTKAPDFAVRVAKKIAEQTRSTGREHIAGLFARQGTGDYKLYLAHRNGQWFRYPNGIALDAFEASAANKVVGFVGLARRVGEFNNPNRSGDIVIATNAEDGWSFDDLESSHGGLLPKDSSFSLTFFGPAVNRVRDADGKASVVLRAAWQADFAPTVLRFLGIDTGDKMTGRALFDEELNPLP